jgi:hypothetical protein
MSGIVQLVAIGPQDQYLTGNPEVTFFKNVYRRYTNFAMEAVDLTFNGSVDFGRKLNVTLPRNGDLISHTYLEIDLPTLTANTGGTVAWTRNIGHVLIKEAELEIGGQRIDRHYGQWLHIWQELTVSSDHIEGQNVLIGNTTTLTTLAASIPARKLTIPLQFQYCRNLGSALPLIAMQYHVVNVSVELRQFSECHVVGVPGTDTAIVPTLSNATLWVDYIYLDKDERRFFAQNGHEYLIEQLQFTGSEGFSQTAVKQRLNFNHPCKMLVWVNQLDSNVIGGVNRWTDFTDGSTPYEGGNALVNAKLMLNGHDRFKTRNADYFNLVQPRQHLPRTPATGIYVYSFAVKPVEHQPSGSVNMSRIENASLQMTMSSSAAQKSYVYATNINILRIVSGMAGLAYSS